MGMPCPYLVTLTLEDEMENTGTYSITEAAEFLKLSPKTIRRYIKAGKLPSTKVPTKFGDEYRITEIPQAMKEEADVQAEAQSKVEIAVVDRPSSTLDAQFLYQENMRLMAQLGAATERLRQMEEQIKLLEAPKAASAFRPWWKRLFSRA
jgi:MerR family copper efflux transcriptional regulator